MVDIDRLHQAGLRATAVRLAILSAVREGNHPDVETVTAAVRDRVGHVSTQAVYDALRALAEAGLVRRIEPAGSAARYESRVGDNHHHLVCRSCGAITDVDCTVGHAPCMEPATDAGYLVDEAEITFWGLCPDCQAPSTTDPVTSTP